MAIPGTGRYNRGTSAYGGTAAPLTPEQLAAQQAQTEAAQANVANSGASLGTLNPSGLFTDRSIMRADQSNAERIAQQQSNFYYGGTEGGADAHAQAVRDSISPISGQLQQYGSDIYGQVAAGTEGFNQGLGGLFGQADALNQYAQQGPGASVAQAQLDANTAMAMRQQLALAGSGRGQGGGASAFRTAAAQQAQIAGQGNAQAAMLAAQEAQNWRQAQLQAFGQAGSLYGQGAQLGGEYAGGMGALAVNAQQSAGNLSLGQEQVATDIYGKALSGTSGYETNLTDSYAIDRNAPRVEKDPGLLALGLGAAGAVAGTYFGPAGTAAGGSLGYALGRELE